MITCRNSMRPSLEVTFNNVLVMTDFTFKCRKLNCMKVKGIESSTLTMTRCCMSLHIACV